MIPFATYRTLAIACGDLDGDMDPDILTGNASLYGDIQNRIYINDDAGSFFDLTSSNLPFDSSYTEDIALGDVDGDLDLDAYLANSSTQQNQLYLNDGAGAFTDATASHLPAWLDSTASVALADVDGDLDLDAVTGNEQYPWELNRLYLNDGSGVFLDVTVTHLPPAQDTTYSVEPADVDGDGDLDLLFGDAIQVRLDRNDGTGVFTDVTSTSLPGINDHAMGLALGDVDADQDIDILIGLTPGYGAGQNRLFQNNGTGVFTDVTSTSLPVSFSWTNDAALADMGGDQDLDALFASNQAFGTPNQLYENDGTGVFTDVSAANLPADPGYTETLEVVDVDGDQDVDVLLGDSGPSMGGQNRLYLNDGAGALADVTNANLPPVIEPSLASTLVDVDGDQDLDAVVANATLTNRLYANDGSGSFTDVSPSSLPPDTDYTTAVAAGDVDGDLDPDLITGNLSLVRLYGNDGTGVFSDWTGTNLPPAADLTESLVFGDVDQDGDLDVWIGNLGQNRLYRNDGSGVFEDATTTNLPADLSNTTAAALADVDGDLDLDAVTGNWAFSYGEQNRLYRNVGSGIFEDVTASSLPAAQDSTTALAVGDVDGDQDVDVLFGNTATEQNRLYRNDGTGTFLDVTSGSLPFDADHTLAVSLGDVDGDQDLDALFGDYDYMGERNRVFENDGGGVFADATTSNLPVDIDWTADLDLRDIDEDKDLDLFVTNSSTSENRILVNWAMQLVWRGTPRIGKSLTLDLFGPAGSPFLLLVSLSQARIPLPYGVLRLDPSTLRIAGTGMLDSQGQGGIALAVPPNPTLVGFILDWQAILGAPLTLTNLEATSFTDL